MRIEATGRAIALLAAVVLVVSPMSVLATHNSHGGHFNIAVADEVDANGNLVPDIDANNPYRFTFHSGLAESTAGDEDLPARSSPLDQTGDRYNSNECEAYGDGTQYADDDAYEDDLRSGDACYVGFLDSQWEYLMAFNLFLTKQPSDLFYGLNPDQSDDYCWGRKNPDKATPDPLPSTQELDEVGSYANRSVVNGFVIFTGECTGEGHAQFLPGNLGGIDTDLLEPAQDQSSLQGSGPTDLADPGSGYNTLPPLVTPFVFLFGQPHPDTVAENRSGLPASDSVYDLAFPQTNNPCGSRTKVCELLSPSDIINYDSNGDNLGEAGGFGSQARVCDFRPQFVTINPDGRSAGLCGIFGDVVNQYIGVSQAGGFGLDSVTSGAPTWINTLPGWYEGVLMITGGAEGQAESLANEYTRIGVPLVTGSDHDGEIEPGIVQYVAINPKVPIPSDPLWCVRPNFLATGDSTLLPAGFTDPGFYGTYTADAIDADIYADSLLNTMRAVLAATHTTVREGVGPGGSVPDDVQGVPVDENSDDKLGMHDVESIFFFAENATDPSALSLPPAVNNIERRADYTEAQDDDPDRTRVSDPVTDPERFDQTLPKGLQCDFQGVVSFSDSDDTLQGGLQFLMNVFPQQVMIKDPTALENLMGVPAPANESNTERNGWQVDVYDFGGSITARTDTNKNGEFDGCASSNGQPQPQNDLCGWGALWDAYNSGCTNIQSVECGDILESLGYNTTRGVGLYFVVKTDGPTLVNDEEASTTEIENMEAIQVLGDQDATATNCIIGISKGFKSKLMNEYNLDVADDQALIDKLCWTGVSSDRQGDALIMTDAFADESGVSPGGFASNVEFGKLVPTPDAADGAVAPDALQGFEVCVTGIWNVVDDPDTTEAEVAGDTIGNLELSGHNEFGDCDLFQDA